MHTYFSRQTWLFTVFLTQSECDSTAGAPPYKSDRRLLKTRQIRAFSSVGVAVRCERGRCEAPPLSPADFSTLGVYPCFSSSRQNTQGETFAIPSPTLPCILAAGTVSPSLGKADTGRSVGSRRRHRNARVGRNAGNAHRGFSVTYGTCVTGRGERNLQQPLPVAAVTLEDYPLFL